MAADRHPWYMAESANDPVLGEILLIWREGVANLASHRRADFPHMIRAAQMLIEEQADRRPFDLVENLLRHILNDSNPEWIHGEQRRDAAIALFGLDDQTYGKSFSSRREEAAHRCNQAVETFRRPERRGMEAVLLRTVASTITEIMDSPGNPEVSVTSTSIALSAELALRGHLVGKSAQVCVDPLPDGMQRGDMTLYLKTLIEWVNRDPWPRDRRFGGPVLTPAAIERKLRITAVADTSREDADADELVQKCRRLVVLGGPGSGKTWLAKRTVRRYAEAALQALAAGASLDEVELPLYITCSSLVGANGDIRQAVVSSALDQLGDLGGSRTSTSLRMLFTERDASTLLVIDSLDEALGSDERLRQADTLPWRIVLTSRPSSWNYQLNIDVQNDSEQIGEMQPLRYPQDVEPFIRGWFVHRPQWGDELVTQLARQPSLQQTATVPLILAFYCIVGGGEPLPEFQRDLYTKVLKRMLTGRWRGSGDHQPNERNCTIALRDWAWSGVTNDPFSGVGTWADEFPTEPVRLSKVDEDALAHIAVPLGPSDIDTGKTLRRFIHRSIREFLVAEHVASLTVDQAVGILLPHIWYDSDWEYAAPAAIVAHPECNQVLRGLLSRAIGSTRLPGDLSALDPSWELRGLLARIAAESSESDWSSEIADVIGLTRVQLAASNRIGLIDRTAHWGCSNSQVRKVLIQFLERGLVTDELLGSLIQLYPTADEKCQIREAMLRLLANPSQDVTAFEMSMLQRCVLQLALTPEDERHARDALLGLLADQPRPWSAAWFANMIGQLHPTTKDQREICDILLDLLTIETQGWQAAFLVAVTVRFASTAAEKRKARRLLLSWLAREIDNYEHAASRFASGIIRLNPTTEEKRQAREVVLGLLVRETSRTSAEQLAEIIAELDPTATEMRQARDKLFSLLTREPDDEEDDGGEDFDMTKHWTAIVLRLVPTEEDKRQAREALLGLLADNTDAWMIWKLINCLVEFSETAKDKCQAREALLGLLAREPEPVAVELIHGVVRLTKTEGDKHQARAVILELLPRANGWGSAELATSLLEFTPGVGDKHLAREALLRSLAAHPSDLNSRELVDTFLKLDPTADDKRRAREMLVGLMVRVTPDDMSRFELTTSWLKLGPTAEEMREIRQTLLSLVAAHAYNGRVVQIWVRSVVALAETAEDKHRAREALFNLIVAHASDERAVRMWVNAVIALAQTAEDKGQIREALLGLLASHKEWVAWFADSFLKLDLTAQEKVRVRQELRGLLTTNNYRQRHAWPMRSFIQLDPQIDDLSICHALHQPPTEDFLVSVRRNSTLATWLAAIPSLPALEDPHISAPMDDTSFLSAS